MKGMEILFMRAMQRTNQSLSAEFEDLNGGCPNVTVDTGFASRPSYLVPLNPSKDPWSWYQRTLTFQVCSALPCPHPRACTRQFLRCCLSSALSRSQAYTGVWQRLGRCLCAQQFVSQIGVV